VLAGVPVLRAQAPAPAQPPALPQVTSQHEANFDAERKQANDLFVAGKIAESLPLYEDLCRQDPTVVVFAERHGFGLLSKAGTMPDGPDKKVVYEKGMAEIRRAQSLGDHSGVVQTILSSATKTPMGATLSGVSLTVGYTHKATPEALAKMREGEIAFQNRDFNKAAALYQEAATLDPAWYEPPVCAGDMYFRTKYLYNAAIWFQKAIDIDPDRDTAYRYWGDTLYRAGDAAKAKLKFEQAVVAEPYARPAWIALQQWATATHTAMIRLQITRPAFVTADGKLQVDPALNVDAGDGHASWAVYQKARIAYHAGAQRQMTVATDINGHLTPGGDRPTLAEEADCINQMLADVQLKLDSGTLTREKLEPSLKNLLALQKDGMIECWILLSAFDAIHYDYPEYRKQHRDLLVAYLDRYVVPTNSFVSQ
jgi:tetratricopeptide (TPR) repeat protein